MTVPFLYPAAPHERRHGPVGYAGYESYRPWLRDEFAFRCVYCLMRETWGSFGSQYAIDHFVPTVTAPEATTHYANLLYVCVTCNGVKSDQLVCDPLVALLDGAVRCDSEGGLHAETPDAAQVIELLDLNDPRRVESRALWISVVGLAERFDGALHRRLLAYPRNLPALSKLSPPGGNAKPEGVEQSYFRQRERGELAETY